MKPTESAVHAVAFAMFNHYHRHVSPKISEEQVLRLWARNRRRDQWYNKAEAACAAYDKIREG